jgi:hypothetical protein
MAGRRYPAGAFRPTCEIAGYWVVEVIVRDQEGEQEGQLSRVGRGDYPQESIRWSKPGFVDTKSNRVGDALDIQKYI